MKYNIDCQMSIKTQRGLIKPGIFRKSFGLLKEKESRKYLAERNFSRFFLKIADADTDNRGHLQSISKGWF